jgi:hypothetical protein
LRGTDRGPLRRGDAARSIIGRQDGHSLRDLRFTIASAAAIRRFVAPRMAPMATKTGGIDFALIPIELRAPRRCTIGRECPGPVAACGVDA